MIPVSDRYSTVSSKKLIVRRRQKKACTSNSNSGYTEAKALEREQAGSSGNTQRRGSLLSRGLERAVSRGLSSQVGPGEGVGVW